MSNIYQKPLSKNSFLMTILFMLCLSSLFLMGCTISETAVAAIVTPPPPPSSQSVDLGIEITDIEITEDPDFSCGNKDTNILAPQSIAVEVRLTSDTDFFQKYSVEINEVIFDTALPELSANNSVTKTFTISNLINPDPTNPIIKIGLVNAKISPLSPLTDPTPTNNQSVATINRCGTEMAIALEMGCPHGDIQTVIIQVSNEGVEDFATDDFHVELVGIDPNDNLIAVYTDIDFDMSNASVISANISLSQPINIQLSTLTTTLKSVRATIVYDTEYDNSNNMINFIAHDDEGNNQETMEIPICADLALTLDKDCPNENVSIQIDSNIPEIPLGQISLLITSTRTTYDSTGNSSSIFITDTFTPTQLTTTFHPVSDTNHITATLLFENDPFLTNNTKGIAFGCSTVSLSSQTVCDPEQVAADGDSISYTLNISNDGTRLVEQTTAVITATYNTGSVIIRTETIPPLLPSQPPTPISVLFPATPTHIEVVIIDFEDNSGEIPTQSDNIKCANPSITSSLNCNEENGLVVTITNDDSNPIDSITAVITTTQAVSTTTGLNYPQNVITKTFSLNENGIETFHFPTDNIINIEAILLNFADDTDDNDNNLPLTEIACPDIGLTLGTKCVAGETLQVTPVVSNNWVQAVGPITLTLAITDNNGNISETNLIINSIPAQGKLKLDPITYPASTTDVSAEIIYANDINPDNNTANAEFLCSDLALGMTAACFLDTQENATGAVLVTTIITNTNDYNDAHIPNGKIVERDLYTILNENNISTTLGYGQATAPFTIEIPATEAQTKVNVAGWLNYSNTDLNINNDSFIVDSFPVCSPEPEFQACVRINFEQGKNAAGGANGNTTFRMFEMGINRITKTGYYTDISLSNGATDSGTHMIPIHQEGGRYLTVEESQQGSSTFNWSPMKIVNYTPGINEPYVIWIDEFNGQNCTAIEVQYPD